MHEVHHSHMASLSPTAVCVCVLLANKSGQHAATRSMREALHGQIILTADGPVASSTGRLGTSHKSGPFHSGREKGHCTVRSTYVHTYATCGAFLLQ